MCNMHPIVSKYRTVVITICCCLLALLTFDPSFNRSPPSQCTKLGWDKPGLNSVWHAQHCQEEEGTTTKAGTLPPQSTDVHPGLKLIIELKWQCRRTTHGSHTTSCRRWLSTPAEVRQWRCCVWLWGVSAPDAFQHLWMQCSKLLRTLAQRLKQKPVLWICTVVTCSVGHLATVNK